MNDDSSKKYTGQVKEEEGWVPVRRKHIKKAKEERFLLWILNGFSLLHLVEKKAIT